MSINIWIRCWRCKNGTQYTNLNPAMMRVVCPCCGEPLGIASAMDRQYGKEVGHEAHKVLAALSKLGDRKNADVRLAIENASQRLMAAITTVCV